jgi:Kef-type K+ transport system membrane component KefB
VPTSQLTHILIALAVVVAAAKVGGYLFRFLGQPTVVGEVLSGIALGPSVFGSLAPALSDQLFSSSIKPFLALVAELGLVLYMLLVGSEIKVIPLGRTNRLLAGVSAGSLLLPFGLGLLVGTGMAGRPDLRPAQVPTAAFVLFVATALTITALPVLASILRERGMMASPIGMLVLAAAGITDVVGWVLVAVDLSVYRGGRLGLVTAAWAAGIIVVALGLLRPLLARSGVLDRMPANGQLTAVVVAATAAAALTTWVGLHAVLGAFLVGLLLPREQVRLAALHRQLEPAVTGFVLPVFFVTSGLGVNLTRLGHDSTLALVLAGTVAVASIGKLVGAGAPARLLGLSWSDACRVGVLLGTRGVTELVVLAIGRDAGLLSGELYTLLVATTLLTTASTGPVLALLDRPKRSATRRARHEASNRQEIGAPQLPHAGTRPARRSLR